jgi:diacylglycerol kinase (ATP)
MDMANGGESPSVLVLVNPVANKKREQMLQQLLQTLSSRHVGYQYLETFANLDGTAAALAALPTSYRQVVVLGGDGTLHQAVNLFAGTQIPIGYIASGTGNDFARGWFGERRLSASEWIEQALYAPSIRIDLGQAGSRYFVNVSGVGFDGALVQKLGARKFIWPKLSYALAALQSLFGYRAQPFELQATNQKLLAIGQRPAFLFTLANSQYFGAGMHIAPHAKMNDGKLAYCFIERCSNFTKLNIFRRVFAGTHGEHAKVHCGQLNAVTVCTQGLPVQADGEWVGETPMIFRTIPAAISIRKPSA